MEKVVDAEGFVPPPNPIGFDVENALKVYARDRLLTRHNLPTSESQWVVRSARPVPYTPTAGSLLKQNRGIFEVTQAEQPPENRTAWVWVTEDGGREIWVLYRPGQVGGFSRVGTPLATTGVIHSTTELYFDRLSADGAPDNLPGDAVALSVYEYGTAISKLRAYIKAERSGGLEIANENVDLVVHDYHILADPGE
jgi:hypothetical protein